MSKQLLKQSGVMFVATMIANVCSYLFNVYVARALGPAGYGILGSLLAIFYIISIPLGTTTTVVAKFTSEFKAIDEDEKIATLLFSSIKKLSKYGAILCVALSLSSWSIADFLNIPSNIPVILTGIFVMFSGVWFVTRGVLQGLQNFNQLGLTVGLEAILRLLLGVLLVSMGFGIDGAILTYALACLIAFLWTLVPLRFLFGKEDKNIDVSEIYQFSFPTLIMLTCLVIMSYIDVVVVKRFLSPEKAGTYAALSTLGKLLFFVPGPFAATMFPQVSKLHAKRKDPSPILKENVIYTGLISGLIIAAYWLFPSPIVGIIFGPEYSSAAPLLGLFGTAIGLMNFVVLYTRYYLAIKDFRFIKILITCACLEIVLLGLFHHSLLQIVEVLLLTYAITMLLLLRYRQSLDRAAV